MKTETEHAKNTRVANRMIKIMQDAGLTPDDMIRVIAQAREKFNEMKKEKQNG